MTQIDFHFDVISPYAWLAFQRLPQALEGLSYSVAYRPLLFAGLLAHHGRKGPAEIEPKRAWTFRQVEWLAHRHGIEFATPAQHPFNPLALLRLLVACGGSGGRIGTPNRDACERVFRHVWCGGGADANDPLRLQTLATALAPRRDPGSDEVKQQLKADTAAAVARGIFGVPTLEIDGRLFWGLDSLDMAAAFLRGDPWFDSDWERAGRARPGIVR
jgi:2-hydroxychromene-2-carboxylate isomerase